MLSRSTVILACCLIFGQSALAASEPQSGYYRDSQKGWWWGERDMPQEEKKEPEKKPVAPPPPTEEEGKPWIPPELNTYKYDDVWNMHPDEFYEFQEAYKKKAVQDPSEDNVRDYYELSEIARKKALAFTNTSQYVWQKHPELTTVKDYPVNTPGNLSRIGQINDEKQRILKNAKDDFALIYFWAPGCPYCEDQKKILKWFKQTSGWDIKEVNINQNPALAHATGVTVTPSVILIKRGEKDFFPVSTGVITAAEIEDKTYRAVRLLSGAMTPQEYSIHEFQKGGGHDVNSKKDWSKPKK